MCKLSSALKRTANSVFLLLGLACFTGAKAQVSVVDFDSDFHVFGAFNNMQFGITPDPTNAANNVGSWNNTGDVWEGAFVQLPEAIFLDSVKTITIQFYAASGDSNTVLIKLEDNFKTDVEQRQSTGGSGWQTLTFDFSQAFEAGTQNLVNATGSYEKMVIFVNGGVSKTGLYYIDDITYPNFETTNELDVIYTNLVYADEFTSFGPIDTAQWFPEVVPPIAGVGWFNGEKQHYTNRAENVFKSNGSLKIIAKKETYTAYGLTLNYTSARLNSKFNFTYGRVDVRAKLPEGAGTWPAIWMLSTKIGNNWHPSTLGWPDCGEIDIMEHWGNDPNVVHGSTHTRSSFGATVNTEEVKRAKVSEGWHVYSLNWSPDQISFLMDGFLFYTYKPTVKNAMTWPFDDPQFILLNVAMGGLYPIDPSFTQSTMEVDYVRVYQNNINIGENTLASRVAVYPNPTTDFVCINAEEPGTFTVYDMLGKKLLEQIITQSGEVKVDLSALAAASYVWQFEAAGKTASGRIQRIHK